MKTMMQSKVKLKVRTIVIRIILVIGVLMSIN